MASSYVKYDPEAVTLEYISGSDWLPLRSSSITISQSYDLSEAGVLSIGLDTLTWSVSDWVTVAHTPLPEKSVVRLRYVQPGVDTLMIAVVTGTSVEYSAAPDPYGRRRWRMTTTYTAMNRPAWRLTGTKRWLAGGLPAEPVSARLGRWIADVDLMGGTDAVMPPETGAGSTTLLEMVRAASDYVGRPVRLVDTGSSTTVTFPPQEFDLPSGWTDADALGLYTKANIAHAMGARAVSQDDVDADTDVSAQLVNDDVRLLYSSWRIPDALPVPFLDPAAVTQFSMTFTPQHCSGGVTFTYATPSATRYRPPARYVPGDSTTSRGNGGSTGGTPVPPDDVDPTTEFTVAFTEIDTGTGTGEPPAGIYQFRGATDNALQDVAVVNISGNVITILNKGTQRINYGVYKGGSAELAVLADVAQGGVSTFDITGMAAPVVLKDVGASPLITVATAPFALSDGLSYTFYGTASGNPQAVRVDDTSADTLYVRNNGTESIIGSIRRFALSDGSYTDESIATIPANGFQSFVQPPPDSGHSLKLWDRGADSWGVSGGKLVVALPIGDEASEASVPDVVIDDGPTMTPVNFYLDTEGPPIAGYFAEVSVGTHMYASPDARNLTTVQQMAAWHAPIRNAVSASDDGSASVVITAQAGDRLYCYASAFSAGGVFETTFTTSDDTALVADTAVSQNGTTDNTVFYLRKFDVGADGTYTISAATNTSTGGISLSVICVPE